MISRLKFRFKILLISLIGEILFATLGYALGILFGYTFGGMVELAFGIVGLILGLIIGNSLSAIAFAKRKSIKIAPWFVLIINISTVLSILILSEPLRLNQNTYLLLLVLIVIPTIVQAIFLKV